MKKTIKNTVTLDINMKDGTRYILYFLSLEDRDRAIHAKKVGKPLTIYNGDGLVDIEGKEIEWIDV